MVKDLAEQELKLHRVPELLGQSNSEDDSALNVFTRSLAYSAAVGPSIAIGELADKVASKLTDSQQSICTDTVKSVAQMAGVQISPEQYSMGSAKWQAQQLGNAVGMLVPMTLLHKSLAPVLPTSAGLRSASSGFAYGAILTPTNLDSSSSLADLLAAKTEKGIFTSLTFGVMGASASRIENLLANSKVTNTVAAVLPEIASVHGTKLAAGVLSAIPGGVVSAQTTAWERGDRIASLQDTTESIASLAYVGGVFGAANFFATKPASKAKPEQQVSTSEIPNVIDTHRFILEEPGSRGRLSGDWMETLPRSKDDPFSNCSSLSHRIGIYKEDRISNYFQDERESEYGLKQMYFEHNQLKYFPDRSFASLIKKSPLIDRQFDDSSARNSLHLKYYKLYPGEPGVSLRTRGSILQSSGITEQELAGLIKQHLNTEIQNSSPDTQSKAIDFFLRTDFPPRRLVDLVPLVDERLLHSLTQTELRVDQQDTIIEKWNSLSEKTKEMPLPVLAKLLNYQNALTEEQLASPHVQEYAELLHELDYHAKGYEHNLDDQFIRFYSDRKLSSAEAVGVLRSWKELTPDVKLLPNETLAPIAYNYHLMTPEQRLLPVPELSRYTKIIDDLQLQENGVKQLNSEFADWYIANSPSVDMALFGLNKWTELSPELRNRLHEPELKDRIHDLQRQWKNLSPEHRSSTGTKALNWAHLRANLDVPSSAIPEDYLSWYTVNRPSRAEARKVWRGWKEFTPAVKAMDAPLLFFLAEHWSDIPTAQRQLEPKEIIRQLNLSGEIGKPLNTIDPEFVEWHRQNEPAKKDLRILERTWADLRSDLKTMKGDDLACIARIWSKLNDEQKTRPQAELLHWSKYYEALGTKPQIEEIVKESPSFRNWFEKNSTDNGQSIPNVFAHWSDLTRELRDLGLKETSELIATMFSQPGRNTAGIIRGLELTERSSGKDPEAAKKLLASLKNGSSITDWVDGEAQRMGLSQLDLLDKMTAISRMSRSFFLEDAPLAELPKELVDKMLRLPLWKLEPAVSLWQNQVRRNLGNVLFTDRASAGLEDVPLVNDGIEGIKKWNETVNNRAFLDEFYSQLDEATAGGRDAQLSSSSSPYMVVRQYFPDLEPGYVNILVQSLQGVSRPKDYVERIQPTEIRNALRRISFSTDEKQNAFEKTGILVAGNNSWVNAQTGHDGRAVVAMNLLSVFGKQWGRWLDLQTLKHALNLEADTKARETTNTDELDEPITTVPLNVAQAVRGMSDARKAELFGSLSESQTHTAIHDAMWMLQKVKREHAESLSQWLFKYFDRDPAELGVVNKRWHRLESSFRTAPYRYADVVNAAKSHNYENIQHSEFAKEAAKWGVSEERYPEYERRFLDSQNSPLPFPLDKAWKVGTYTGRFLPRSDVRGVFLGQHSTCCQHPDNSAGNSAAWMGQEHPAAGFFVVESATKKIVAQSLVWQSDNGGLVFDSIEGKRPKLVELEADQNAAAQNALAQDAAAQAEGAQDAVAQNIVAPNIGAQADTRNAGAQGARAQNIGAQQAGAQNTGDTANGTTAQEKSNEAKAIEHLKKTVSDIYDAAAKYLIKDYSRISVGVGQSAGKSIADFDRWQASEAEEIMETPKDYSGYSDARKKQLTIATNENPVQAEPTTQAKTWTRAATPTDLVSAKKIAEAVYPRGWNFISPGDWNRVLQSKEKGVIGYATMDTRSHYITDVAVLPEYGGKSVLLLRDILSEVKRIGGNWKANARASTSYELLKRAEALRWIQIDREIHRPGIMSGEDMYDIIFHVPDRQRNNNAAAQANEATANTQ